MKIQAAFKMACGPTGLMGCAVSMIAGIAGSAHFLGWWAVLTIPVVLVVGFTCMMLLLDWATEP